MRDWIHRLSSSLNQLLSTPIRLKNPSDIIPCFDSLRHSIRRCWRQIAHKPDLAHLVQQDSHAIHMANNETSGDKTLPTERHDRYRSFGELCAAGHHGHQFPMRKKGRKSMYLNTFWVMNAKVNSIHCVFPSEWKVQTIFLRLHVHIIYP